MPSKLLRLSTIANGILSSIITLIILVNSFDSSGEKYVPAMILANKFAFPLIISALALFFLVFFEPDALKKRTVIVVFRLLFFITLAAFSYYIIFVQSNAFVSFPFFLICGEEILLLLVTIQLSKIHNS